MGIKQFIGYALLVLASLVVSAQGSDFEFYKLSLIWPSSACYPLSNCTTPLPTFFTIHGLWPTFANDTAVPAYGPNNRCNANPVGPDAAVAKLTPVQDRLNERWPNLRAGVENSVFWRHEWQKHGICSDYYKDPLSYFNDTLNLATSTTFDPFKALGVQPSDTPYLLNTLLQNVYTKMGAYPQISCSQRSGGALYLREIRFCLKRTKKTPPSVVQSCPTTVAGGCKDPLTDNVHFPPAN
ncbi:ribonuclease 1-like [Gossypium arboreum]|uniref:Uncharacterized protein n=1 Tax=Gossypium arboreum TaxID=29729 RepID=A0ABR0PQF3_GOSAR|nr:ribonuclease 1-like [Gossypium arboreum]KAK5826670.1 hypothetical protein PVK06_021596 [Gossypium arboreum]